MAEDSPKGERLSDIPTGEALLLLKLYVEQHQRDEISIDKLPYTSQVDAMAEAMNATYPESKWTAARCYRVLVMMRKGDRVPRLAREYAGRGKKTSTPAGDPGQ